MQYAGKMDGDLTLLNNKKIITITGSLELGGAERQALRYALYLRNEFDADIEVCGFYSPGKAAEFCDRNAIPWRILTNPLSEKRGVHRFFRFRAFVHEISTMHPDIILPYTLIPNVAAGLSWRKTGAKLCVWNQRDGGIERFDQKLESRALHNTPLALANSAAVQGCW